MTDLEMILTRQENIRFHNNNLQKMEAQLQELDRKKEKKIKELETEYNMVKEQHEYYYKLISRSKEFLMEACDHSILIKYQDDNMEEYVYCLSCGFTFKLHDPEVSVDQHNIIDLNLTQNDLPIVIKKIEKELNHLYISYPSISLEEIKKFIMENFSQKELKR